LLGSGRALVAMSGTDQGAGASVHAKNLACRGVRHALAHQLPVPLLALLALVPLGAPALAFLVTLTAGLLAGILVPRALARPVGGMTGDLFGATVILVETVVLLIGAVIL